jgi:hypothetical protein
MRACEKAPAVNQRPGCGARGHQQADAEHEQSGKRGRAGASCASAAPKASTQASAVSRAVSSAGGLSLSSISMLSSKTCAI